jgi:hypothetical protein
LEYTDVSEVRTTSTTRAIALMMKVVLTSTWNVGLLQLDSTGLMATDYNYRSVFYCGRRH